MTAPGLERSYRRLLWAYPGRWRRSHGTEMVTTLLEMSAPGQRRPAVADAWDLVRGGVRERFRLPARRRPAMVLVAVLCAVIGGAFGAAAGSLAGEQTFAPLPGEAAMIALSQEVAAVPGAPTTTDRASSPWWAVRANTTTELPTADWDAEAARQRLIADGWVVRPIDGGATTIQAVDTAGNDVLLKIQGWSFVADRDGLGLWVTGSSSGEAGSTMVSMWQKTTPVYRPLLIGGALLGLLAGWLIGAAVLRRIRPAGAVLLAGSVLVLAIPVGALYRNLWRAMGDQALRDAPPFTVHSALTFAGDYYPLKPVGLVPVLAAAGLVIGAVALTVALLTRPGPGATVREGAVSAG